MWRLLSLCELYIGSGIRRSPDRRNFAGPWVTSVGGTKLKAPYDVEEVASSFSGGGFSAFFNAEKYQWLDLGTFLWKLGSKYEGLYKCVRSRGLNRPILTM